VRKHRFGLAEEENQVGEVTGLAWTSEFNNFHSV
jgi:ATP-dependent Lon protease